MDDAKKVATTLPIALHARLKLAAKRDGYKLQYLFQRAVELLLDQLEERHAKKGRP